ncbi:hypothetical protein JCM9957A_52430 [Kineosporia succinea]
MLLSCAVSIDGYIDDTTPQRLLLSNDADFERVDAERAACDAILVGSSTIRHDNPRLQVRSEAARRERQDRGLPPTPLRVTVTGSGDLDAGARFFDPVDGAGPVVYASTPARHRAQERVGHVATVVDAGDPLDLHLMLADLTGRGVRRLMVEGGSAMHTQFLGAGLADELQLVVAPVFVGDSGAPRFVGDGEFPFTSGHRAQLAAATPIGDVVLLRYTLSDRTSPV